MKPQWFDVQRMPGRDDMPFDFEHWCQHWLEGRKFDAYFLTDHNLIMLDHRVNLISGSGGGTAAGNGGGSAAEACPA